MKNAGPLEATAVGAKFGPIGAGVGFLFGTVNGIAGVVNPMERMNFTKVSRILHLMLMMGQLRQRKNVGKLLLVDGRLLRHGLEAKQ
mgnify:CR=1 FL=1